MYTKQIQISAVILIIISLSLAVWASACQSQRPSVIDTGDIAISQAGAKSIDERNQRIIASLDRIESIIDRTTDTNNSLGGKLDVLEQQLREYFNAVESIQREVDYLRAEVGSKK